MACLLAAVGSGTKTTERGLQDLCGQQIICRIWAHDHTVWKPRPTGITNRLGLAPCHGTRWRNKWIDLQPSPGGWRTRAIPMPCCWADWNKPGARTVPETFGAPRDLLTRPSLRWNCDRRGYNRCRRLKAAEAAVDLTKPCSLSAPNRAGTVETLSALKYFYNRLRPRWVRPGGHPLHRRTDPGSKIVTMAERYHFAIFSERSRYCGRYSALSYFGLVPAGGVGADVGRGCWSAPPLPRPTHRSVIAAISDNLAARVGTAMGVLAQSGRDKITFITSLR